MPHVLADSPPPRHDYFPFLYFPDLPLPEVLSFEVESRTPGNNRRIASSENVGLESVTPREATALFEPLELWAASKSFRPPLTSR